MKNADLGETKTSSVRFIETTFFWPKQNNTKVSYRLTDYLNTVAKLQLGLLQLKYFQHTDTYKQSYIHSNMHSLDENLQPKRIGERLRES